MTQDTWALKLLQKEATKVQAVVGHGSYVVTMFSGQKGRQMVSPNGYHGPRPELGKQKAVVIIWLNIRIQKKQGI